MNPAAFGLIVTGVLLNAIAQLALKASVNRMGPIAVSLQNVWPTTQRLVAEPALWLGLGCYGISVVVWILALSRVDVSIAYPMLSLGYVVNAIAAWWLFSEALGPGRVAGILIIILGVIVLSKT